MLAAKHVTNSRPLLQMRAPLRTHRARHAVSAASCGEGRLVGLTAPDFEADAVFDQEFTTVKLSEYWCVFLQRCSH
jgi:peroxiredoxin (alkyl hydroperoxide reductase subunit C)